MSEIKLRLSEFSKTISSDLDRSVEFWLKHSHDDEFGGFFTCLEADGKVFDDTKYCWLISRQIWSYATLYHNVPRFHNPHIIEAARKGADFAMKHSRNPITGRCYFNLTRDGRPMELHRTVFSECFYIMAMAGMYLATKEIIYKEEAMTTMRKVMHWTRIDDSGLGPSLSPPAPIQTISLAVPMHILMALDQVEDIVEGGEEEEEAREWGEWCVAQLLKHVQRGGDVVVENVLADGQELAGSNGRFMNPGHVIEGGWFLLKRAVKQKNLELEKIALDTFITQTFRRAWDDEFGGLYCFIDIDGRPPTKAEWNMKLWWSHCEALIAFLMAYRHTRNEEYLRKFAQVFDYSYKHFVDFDHGEWFGFLSREGKISIPAKGGEWKGCFHVPRTLMMCEQILHELLQSS